VHSLVIVQKELPEQWNNTKKLAISIKQQVTPLQANEVANIRRKLAEFDIRQQEFREDFRKMAAFSHSCVNPYDELDKVGSVSVNYAALPIGVRITDCTLSVRPSVLCLPVAQARKVQQAKNDEKVALDRYLIESTCMIDVIRG